MYRFLLTPRWWGINLFAVLAIPVCLFMGSWQLSRFEARVESHDRQQRTVSHAAHAKPEALSSLLPVTEATSGRTAEVTGRYDDRRQLVVPGRELDGKRGAYVLSLLRTEGGKALPVVRGWLPGDPAPADVPPAPRGEVRVTGAVQASESQGSPGVGPEAEGGLPEGRLGMISAAALVNVVPYDVQDAWITVQRVPHGSELRPVPPVRPGNTGLDMKAFQNLGYTAEWFVFAGFVVFMWFRLLRRDAELAKDAELGLTPPPRPPRDGEDPDDAGRSRSPAATV